MCLRFSRDAPARLGRSDASARAVRCQATANPLAGNPNRSFSGLWLQTTHLNLIRNRYDLPNFQPARSALADQHSSLSLDDELESECHCAAVWPGLSSQPTTVVPLQFPRIEHSLLPLPSSLLDVIFKPLTPHGIVLAPAILTMSRPGRGQMVRELIRRILHGIP